MVFGLQKLTLLDYPGLVACTVFSSGCNFSCPFCHNGTLAKGGAPEGFLSSEEVFSFLKKRSGLLDGICLTGGEFLLHAESVEFISHLKGMGYKVKLDTNGSFPERLDEVLKGNMVDYVAMDIKNSPEKYAETCGNASALPLVQKSVEILKHSETPFEFRTTVTGKFHTKEDIASIGEWIRGAERYFLQPYMESEDILKKDPAYPVGNEALAGFLAVAQRFVPGAAIRGR
ncbi:MAG: anaerobic ribonucleoside-triphosphate reductase activating protein [Lentisphaeria bacterium]|nr:anaerobic ribonucleoside-triphosphate reductase activating protein [Lentisphaeria bacterium]